MVAVELSAATSVTSTCRLSSHLYRPLVMVKPLPWAWTAPAAHARPTDTARILNDNFTGISVGMAWLDFRAYCRDESGLRKADIRRAIRYVFLLLCLIICRRGDPGNESGTNGGIGRTGGGREVSHATDSAARPVLAPGSPRAGGARQAGRPAAAAPHARPPRPTS